MFSFRRLFVSASVEVGGSCEREAGVVHEEPRASARGLSSFASSRPAMLSTEYQSPWTPTESDEARGGEARQLVEQFVLEAPVADRGMRVGPVLVVPVAAGGARVGVLAGGKPLLREVPEP
jgi:hypothetical protein